MRLRDFCFIRLHQNTKAQAFNDKLTSWLEPYYLLACISSNSKF